jgi:hypothetical protein
MKKLLKVARKRAGLKLFDVKGGVAQLRHVPGDCLVQKVLGPEEMLEDGQYITEDGASFERVSVYAEVLAESAFARSLRPTGAEINVPIGDAAFLLAADALHRSGPFTEVFFTSYGQAFSSDQFRIHSVDTPDLVLPEDMKGVRMGKKDLATFCKLARMYKAKTIKLAIFTSERGAVCVRGEFGPVSATSLCGAPDDKAEAFVAALRKFESDAARCAVPVGRLGLKHAEFVAALKVFKGKSPARLAHAYISEEGHLCPWGDRRRSAIIAQTSVKHGGGVAINLGFLKDSGAWDQDFYVARPGAMGAGQKACLSFRVVGAGAPRGVKVHAWTPAPMCRSWGARSPRPPCKSPGALPGSGGRQGTGPRCSEGRGCERWAGCAARPFCCDRRHKNCRATHRTPGRHNHPGEGRHSARRGGLLS